MPTVFLALLLNSFTFAAIIVTIVLLLLLLLNYCCHYITITTNKLCQARYFSGAAELTTQLLRLINILWLPLCRINKLGYINPRRLLRSPTLVDHHMSVFLLKTHLQSTGLTPSGRSTKFQTWFSYMYFNSDLMAPSHDLESGRTIASE